MPEKPDRDDTSPRKKKSTLFDAPTAEEMSTLPNGEHQPDPGDAIRDAQAAGELASFVVSDPDPVSVWNAGRIAKPRRITSDTVDVLTRLDAAIAAATKHLKKMPGARKEGVEVDVANVLVHEEYPCYSDEYVLTFYNDTIQVRNEFMPHPETDAEVTRKPLDKYDTDTRIQLCKYIPDLITAAKAAEEKVREEAEDAIASIEQAIAMSLEVGDE